MSLMTKQGAPNEQAVPSDFLGVTKIPGLVSQGRVLSGKAPVRVSPCNYYLVAGAGVLTLALLIGLPVALMSMGPPKKAKTAPLAEVAQSITPDTAPTATVSLESTPPVAVNHVVPEQEKKHDTTHVIPADQSTEVIPTVSPVNLPVEFASLQTKKIVDDGLPKFEDGNEFGPGNPEKRQFSVEDLNASGLIIPDSYLKQLFAPKPNPLYSQHKYTVFGSNVGQPGYVVNNSGTNGPSYVITTPVINLPQLVVVTPVIQVPHHVVTPPKMKWPNMVTMGPRVGYPSWMLPKSGQTKLSFVIPNKGDVHCAASRMVVFWGNSANLTPHFVGSQLASMIPNFGGGKKPGMIPNFGGGKVPGMIPHGGGKQTVMLPPFGGNLPKIPNFGGGKQTAMVPNQGGGRQNLMPPSFGNRSGGGLLFLTNYQGGGGNMSMPKFSGSGRASGGCMK